MPKKRPIYSDEEIGKRFDYMNEAQLALNTAKKKESDGRSLPLGGKPTKMGESIFGNGKAASEAYDKLQNMREEEVEVQRERSRQHRSAIASMRRINDEWDAADPGTIRRDNKVRKN